MARKRQLPVIEDACQAHLAEWRGRKAGTLGTRLCEEAVWFTQNMLLGTKQDMEQIAEAVTKVQKHATLLARS